LNDLKKSQKLRSLARGRSVPGEALLSLVRWRKTMNNLMIELSWLITILLWPDVMEAGALQEEPVVVLSHYPIHGPLKSKQRRF
jgi:hypothetical protein